MPETIILLTSTDEEDGGNVDAVKTATVEDDGMVAVADPTAYCNCQACLDAGSTRSKKLKRKRKTRKRRIDRFIELHVAQAQLGVDAVANSNYQIDSRSSTDDDDDDDDDNDDDDETFEVLKSEINEEEDERHKLIDSNARKDEARFQRTDMLIGNEENVVVTIDISSSVSQDEEANTRFCSGVGEVVAGETSVVKEAKKKRRRGRGRNRNKHPDMSIIPLQKARYGLERDGSMGNKSISAFVSAFEDEVVLRRLLRKPRYFDPPDSGRITCPCGEDPHTRANCALQNRKKPCFLCASFQHSAKHCRRQQRRKESLSCEETSDHCSLICLRCGDYGHDMFSCVKDYSTDDLKEIQCYVCKNLGHLCCIELPDISQPQVSCYNCGQSGHMGSECTWKIRTYTWQRER